MISAVNIQQEAARLFEGFKAAGAVSLETSVLQDAATLLDLYGEDIRARAFVTNDPLQGELMLRPDFTVPVVQMHMEHGALPARYTYMGKVFRRQDDNPERPNEYVQVGYEVFDRENPAAADAEVFALIAESLGDAPVRAATGDIGILMQAVQGLQTTERRKAALLRHIWRPTRFRQLLARFAGETEVPPSRANLLAQTDPFEGAGPQIGLRSRDEVEARIAALKEDAATAPISKEEVALIGTILDIRAGSVAAHEALVDLSASFAPISSAVEVLGARLEAMSARGVDVASLEFEGGYGRTSMEYYDGFVFGFYADAALNLPAIASGGRYDALTTRLGQGSAIPAVGAVIRPEFLLMTKGAA